MSNRVRLIPRKCPPLLLTESEEEFKALRARLWKTFEPRDEIEQIFCEDFVYLVWETLRLRRCKVASLNQAFYDALYEILVDKFDEFKSGQRTVAHFRKWFADKSVRQQISEILAKYGLDESAIEAAAFRQCSPELVLIEQLLTAGEAKKEKKLECIGMYRESLAQQLHDTAIEVAKNEARPLIELKKTSSAR